MDSRNPLFSLELPRGEKRKERRRKERFSFVTTLMYRLKHNSHWEGTGRTVNMSSDAILMSADRAFAPGSKIEVSLDWPGLYHNAGRMRLVLTARVLRSEGSQTAVRILEHEFVHVLAMPRMSQKRGAAARTEMAVA